MLYTKDLILDKAKFSDWKSMYYNVWSRPESAKYMTWGLTTSEENAQLRIQKTIAFQESHDTYLVYDRKSGDAIGFAGVEELTPGVYGETGICLGPDYVGKGLGKQILTCLIEYCKNQFRATEFHYSTREKNEASNGLARSFGFEPVGSEVEVDERDGSEYRLLKYCLRLEG